MYLFSSFVKGRGGSTIKTIQERTGSNVQIPPQPDENNPLVRTINITHPLKEQAEMTRYYIAGVLSKNTEVMQQLGLASNAGYYGSGGNADHSVQVQVNILFILFACFVLLVFGIWNIKSHAQEGDNFV